MTKSSYDSLGVSASKAGLHKTLSQAGLSVDPALFSPVVEDIAGSSEHFSFIHCDGAGTKSIVAYLYYRETGDPSLFSHLAQDALVMNLDDIFCIGLPENLVLANAIGRNSQLISDELIGLIISRYRELTKQLNTLGIPLTMSGGETADCGDVVRTLLVDAVVMGRLRKKHLISTKNIAAGDCIVGLSSSGKASYEESENSGIGSNGLTLARHALINKTTAGKYPEVCDPSLDSSVTYRGRFNLSDSPEDLGMNIGQALASPTRTYAPILAKVYAELGKQVHAAIHLTGGGQTKVLRFGDKLHFIKDSLFSPPTLFKLIQESGSVAAREMFQVFNMGHRMELYLPEKEAVTVCSIAKDFNVEAKVVGRVEKSDSDKNELTIKHQGETHHYTL